MRHRRYRHGCNDNQWHYLEFDLAERLFTIAGETLAAVDGIVIRCTSLYVDDAVLSSGGPKCASFVSHGLKY